MKYWVFSCLTFLLCSCATQGSMQEREYVITQSHDVDPEPVAAPAREATQP